MTVAKKTSKKNSKKVEVIEQKKIEQKKEEVREAKKISNTQRCADMIMSLARDAKHTRQEIVQTVSGVSTPQRFDWNPGCQCSNHELLNQVLFGTKFG